MFSFLIYILGSPLVKVKVKPIKKEKRKKVLKIGRKGERMERRGGIGERTEEEIEEEIEGHGGIDGEVEEEKINISSFQYINWWLKYIIYFKNVKYC